MDVITAAVVAAVARAMVSLVRSRGIAMRLGLQCWSALELNYTADVHVETITHSSEWCSCVAAGSRGGARSLPVVADESGHGSV